MKVYRLMVQLAMVTAMSMCLALVSQNPALAAGECQGDIAKFCQGAKTPKEELACLKAHKKQLSPQCKKHILQVAKEKKQSK
ncbi:MAG: hypothetical protein ACLPXB_10975 [Thiobacillaceae bacterium]